MFFGRFGIILSVLALLEYAGYIVVDNTTSSIGQLMFCSFLITFSWLIKANHDNDDLAKRIVAYNKIEEQKQKEKRIAVYNKMNEHKKALLG